MVGEIRTCTRVKVLGGFVGADPFTKAQARHETTGPEAYLLCHKWFGPGLARSHRKVLLGSIS